MHPWQQILIDAANVIRVRGLAKHRMVDDSGRVCLMGALYQSVCGDPDPEDLNTVYKHPKIDVAQFAQNQLAEYLGFRRDGGGGHDLVRWNNADERTVDEVVSALENAAKLPA